MIVLHLLRDSEGDTRGWVGQEWQFQRDIVIEQPLNAPSKPTYRSRFLAGGGVEMKFANRVGLAPTLNCKEMVILGDGKMEGFGGKSHRKPLSYI